MRKVLFIWKIAVITAVFGFLSGCNPVELVENVEPTDLTVDIDVIYGPDDRKDLYQVSDPQILERARSTVMLVQDYKVSSFSSDTYQISGQTYGVAHQLCTTEKFWNQKAAGFCSGSLIAPDIVLTAGHCLPTEGSCQNTKFVFGYGYDSVNSSPDKVSKTDVYGCEELIHTEDDFYGADFALVRLDRQVLDRDPLPIRTSGMVSQGEAVMVVGHPSGLPTKVASNARVRSSQHPKFFTTNLDAYGGNSGSAVFNESSGLIEGILVRGPGNFLWQSGCYASLTCTNNGCLGVDVTRVSEIYPYLESLEPTPPPPEAVHWHERSVGQSIPDNSQNGLFTFIDVPSSTSGSVHKVRVDIDHPYKGDVVIYLVAPSGNYIQLKGRTGGSGDDIKGTFGVDLEPVESFSFLSNEGASGRWYLYVGDHAFQDQGVLNNWAISFE